MKEAKTFYALLSFAIMGIMALPVGIANLFFGYVLGDSPCILCWGQRLSMVYIAASGLFILRYGFKPRYVGAILIAAAFGLYQSFYHLGAHALEDIGQGFALEIFSIHTQFWAEVVFWSVVVVLGILLLLAPCTRTFVDEMGNFKQRKVVGTSFAAFCVFFAITFSNIVQAFISSGPPPYVGPSDPQRFSFDLIKHNSWSTHAWGGFFREISFLGKRRSIDLPDLPSRPDLNIKFDNDPSNSPLEINSQLKIGHSFELPAKIEPGEGVNSVNYVSDRFWIGTEKHRFYVLNDGMNIIERSMLLDNYYSATVGEVVGINPVGSAMRIMGNNKTSVDVTPRDNADPVDGYKHFIEGADKWTSDTSSRKRLKTSRSKLNYIGAAVSDGKHTHMITVPNRSYPQLVVVSQLDSDWGLASEYKPEISDRVKLKDGRSIDELYVTAAAYKNGKIYAASKNYNTILVIDTASRSVVDSISFPSEIKNVRGMCFDGEVGVVVMISYDGQKNMVHVLY